MSLSRKPCCIVFSVLPIVCVLDACQKRSAAPEPIHAIASTPAWAPGSVASPPSPTLDLRQLDQPNVDSRQVTFKSDEEGRSYSVAIDRVYECNTPCTRWVPVGGRVDMRGPDGFLSKGNRFYGASPTYSWTAYPGDRRTRGPVGAVLLGVGVVGTIVFAPYGFRSLDNDLFYVRHAARGVAIVSITLMGIGGYLLLTSGSNVDFYRNNKPNAVVGLRLGPGFIAGDAVQGAVSFVLSPGGLEGSF